MAFDAATYEAPVIDPLTLTTPRARLEYMRDFLRELPAERFDMYDYATRIDGRVSLIEDGCGPTGATVKADCGTAACIAGWAVVLFAPTLPMAHASEPACELLGLTESQGDALFLPRSFWARRYATTGAVAVLDHLLTTGQVDWSVAKTEA